MTRAAFWLVSLLIFVGCAVPAGREEAPNKHDFLVLTPQSLGRNLTLSQLVTGRYDGRTYRARYEIDVAGDRLTIAGLSPIGLTLFTLVQQGESVSVDSRVGAAPTFDPRYTLFDLYLTYWPENAVRAALEINGMTLEKSASGKTRIVRDGGGRKVATVRHPSDDAPGGQIVIEHFDRPYNLTITSIKDPNDP